MSMLALRASQFYSFVSLCFRVIGQSGVEVFVGLHIQLGSWEPYTIIINMSQVGLELGVGGITVFEDCEATALTTQPPLLDLIADIIVYYLSNCLSNQTSIGQRP